MAIPLYTIQKIEETDCQHTLVDMTRSSIVINILVFRAVCNWCLHHVYLSLEMHSLLFFKQTNKLIYV